MVELLNEKGLANGWFVGSQMSVRKWWGRRELWPSLHCYSADVKAAGSVAEAVERQRIGEEEVLRSEEAAAGFDLHRKIEALCGGRADRIGCRQAA